MEDSENREKEDEVEEFMALLERIESEKRYRKEIEDTHKKDSVKISQTWLSSFQWEDFSRANNVPHPFQSQGDGQHQSHGDELEEQQCDETRESMKRKRESSPTENNVDNKSSPSKENHNNNKRVIADFDLNKEGESEIQCSMGLSL